MADWEPVFNPDNCDVAPIRPIEEADVIDCQMPDTPGFSNDCQDVDIPLINLKPPCPLDMIVTSQVTVLEDCEHVEIPDVGLTMVKTGLCSWELHFDISVCIPICPPPGQTICPPSG